MSSRRFHFLLLIAAILLLSSVPLHADIFAPTDLPYRGEPATICYLTAPPTCITNGIVWKPRNWNPQIIPLTQENESFDATFDGDISFFGGPSLPFSLDGTMLFEIPGRTDVNQTGVFPFTISQFDFAGGGLSIRESPTQLSTGQTTITPQGDGFRVSSFFDVFTELSLDGGQTWIPSTASSHFESTPEPATMLLTGGALILIARRIRRRQSRP